MSSKPSMVEFQPGDYLARETCGCDALYVIKEGQCQVYRTTKDGKKVFLAIISSGQYVGETALLMQRPFNSSVVALTKVTAVKLTRVAVEAQLKEVPKWLVALTKGLIARLESSNEMIRKHGLVDEKLASTVQAMEANMQAAKEAAASTTPAPLKKEGSNSQPAPTPATPVPPQAAEAAPAPTEAAKKAS